MKNWLITAIIILFINLTLVSATDIIPPTIISVGPQGIVTTSNPTLNVQTNEVAKCKFSSSDVDYDEMSSFFGSYDTLHSQSLTLEEGDYDFYVRCEDTSGNTNLQSYIISFSVSFNSISNIIQEVFPPIIMSSEPSGAINSSDVVLKVQTDKTSTCRYSTRDVSYANMKDNFNSILTLEHEKSLTLDNGIHTFYIRCKDINGNSNSKSYIISFKVELSTNSCNGCFIDGSCYNIGFRQNEKYCNADKIFVNQLEEELQCDNNFECSSNVCTDNQCVKLNPIKRFIGWIKFIFRFK